MKRLEASIEQAAVAAVRLKLGVIGVKLTTSDDGWPDRFFIIPGGRPLLVEFKRPGEVPRPKQVDVHNQLKAMGYDVEVTDNVADCVDLVLAALQRAAGGVDA